MKVMAGYDTRNKTNYRAKAAEEVSKVQQKAKILEEMLEGFKEGDQIQEGDVFEVRRVLWLDVTSADRPRNSRMLYKAPIRRFRRCVKKNQTTRRQ